MTDQPHREPPATPIVIVRELGLIVPASACVLDVRVHMSDGGRVSAIGEIGDGDPGGGR